MNLRRANLIALVVHVALEGQLAAWLDPTFWPLLYAIADITGGH